jgi:hypothetical protein
VDEGTDEGHEVCSAILRLVALLRHLQMHYLVSLDEGLHVPLELIPLLVYEIAAARHVTPMHSMHASTQSVKMMTIHAWHPDRPERKEERKEGS